MISIMILTAFSTMVMLRPPTSVALILDIKPIPTSAKWVLMGGTLANVILSIAFERYLHKAFARLLGFVFKLRYLIGGHPTRTREGKAYRAVETGIAHGGTL